jgi:RNA polymerase sigma factor (sigma-70 family)
MMMSSLGNGLDAGCGPTAREPSSSPSSVLGSACVGRLSRPGGDAPLDCLETAVALLQACSKIRSFDSTSPILPWLIVILCNQFYSECRKRGREVEDVDGIYASTLVTGPNQIAHAELKDLDAALLKLPDEMRAAVITVGWEGLSYQDAARAFDCPVGTVRSRVHRARASLAALLDIERTAALAGRAA